MNKAWDDYQADARAARVKEYGYDILQAKNQSHAAMLLLAEAGAVFLGQNVGCPGSAMYADFDGISMSQRIELPVVEELQLGMATGMALAGLLPVCVYPRLDFLLRAMDQLVNHLDKIPQMSCGQWNPKVIIRTKVGATSPLNAGPQHTQNHTAALRLMLQSVLVCETVSQAGILNAYQMALARQGSTLIVER